MMTEEVRRLYVYPSPISKENMEYLREAKAKLGVPFKIIPSTVPSNQWVRILALGAPPQTIDPYALVRDPSDIHVLMAAMLWATSDVKDARATDVIDTLESIFKGKMKEIDYRQIAMENITKNLHIGDDSSVPSMR